MMKPIKLPTLLVITDNPSIRFWMKKHLDDHFFVIVAEKKQEALFALDTRLDFIFIDSEIEDSLDLCKELVKITQKKTPILMITGKLKKSYRQKAKDAGVSDFLSDSLDLDELMERIEDGFKTAHIRQKTKSLGREIAATAPKSSDYLKKKKIKKGQKK